MGLGGWISSCQDSHRGQVPLRSPTWGEHIGVSSGGGFWGLPQGLVVWGGHSAHLLLLPSQIPGWEHGTGEWGEHEPLELLILRLL